MRNGRYGRQRSALHAAVDVPFANLRRGVDELRPEIDAAIARVLDSGWFVLGEEGRRFEAELYRFAENAHRPVLESIRTKKVLDDDLRNQVVKLIEEFKARFVAEMPQTAHA